MAERETRRQRQERLRSEGDIPVPQLPKGRTKWPSVTIAIGTALLIAASAGGVGIYYHLQPQEQVEVVVDNQALLEGEIKRLGIEKSQKEIELWGKVDDDIKKHIEQNTFTTAKKLSLITEAMQESENPYFSNAGKFFQDQFNQGNLGTRITQTPIGRPSSSSFTYLIVTEPIIIQDKLIIGLEADAEEMMKAKPVEIATFITHEMEHGQNLFETDRPVANKTASERLENQRKRIKDVQELIAEEARGYMKQMKSIIYHLGLTVNDDQFMRGLATNFTRDDGIKNLVDRSILAQGNPSDTDWKQFTANYYPVSN